MEKRQSKEAPLIHKPGTGVIFAWVEIEGHTMYMTAIKKLEKMFKIKIIPKQGDVCLDSDSQRRIRVFQKGKWTIIS